MDGQTFDIERTDTQLLQGIAHGDEASLAALYDRYHLLSISLALRIVSDRGRAEDVVQDAFLSVWRKAGSYVAGRGSVKTWLTSIVRNRAIDRVRARRESDSDDEAVLLALRDPRPGVVEQVTASLERETIRTAIAQLPIEQRQAIAMAYFEGLSHSEISDATSLPLGTVKSRIRLGMHRLKGLLMDAGVAPIYETSAPMTVPAMVGSHPG